MAAFYLQGIISEKYLFLSKFCLHTVNLKTSLCSKRICFVFLIFSISQICADPDENMANDSNEEQSVKLKNSLTKPVQVFKVADETKILSLSFYNNFLIVGTCGLITGYTWLKNRLTKKSWEIHVSAANKDFDQQNDINCLWLNRQAGILYAGCGDNNICAINLEDGKILRQFPGHTDYIHWLDGDTDHNLYSASEDGTVRFWDTREKRAVNQIEPHKNEKLVRPQFGKWIGAVAVTDDWLICGGGPKVSLWHLRSLECTTVFPYTKQAHTTGFIDDIVFIGGDYNHLCQYNLKGDLTAELAVSASSIYSVVNQMEPKKFMSIAGSSNQLDICTDFNYKDIVLTLYESNKKV